MSAVTPAARDATRARRRRRGLVAASVLLALVVAMVARPTARRPDELGIDGTGPSGLGVVAAALRGFDVTVVEDDAGIERADVVVVASHASYSREQAEELRARAAAGGRIVLVDDQPVAGRLARAELDEAGGPDPGELAPQLRTRERAFVPFGVGARLGAPACDVAGFAPGFGAAVTQVDTIANERLVPAAGDVACFPEGDAARDGALLLRLDLPGEQVLLASDEWLRNAGMSLADNGAAALALLAPPPGGRVLFLERRADGLEPQLLDLVGPRFWSLVAWGVVLFVLVAVRRARRLGAPVGEAVPVVVEGADLVVAVGGLLARGRNHAVAAEALRADLRDDVARFLGLPRGTTGFALLDAVQDRAATQQLPIDPTTIARALGGSGVVDDAEFVAVARAVAAVRRALVPRRATT